MNNDQDEILIAMSILSVRDISKTYNAKKIVANISLSIKAGEIIGLLGPNGAGKTTCFHMLVGLVSIDSGSIYLDDHEISDLPIDKRALLGLGYLPQEPSVFRKMTVADNILAILEIYLADEPQKIQPRLERLLEKFNITHIRDSQGMNLSGGERRRLEIARALASEPRFLMLDEPFAGIDPISINDLQKLIKQLQEDGIGVLITDHNVRETLNICDRAYIVNDGRILTEGSPKQILNNEQVQDIYLGKRFMF